MKKYTLFVLLLLLVSGFYNGLFLKITDQPLVETFSWLSDAPKDQNQHFTKDSVVLASQDVSIVQVSLYEAGKIGHTQGRKFDNPEDNVFAIELKNALNQAEVWELRYQVRGVGMLGVVRAINDELSVGGRLVERNEQWQQVVEKIHVEQLRNGRNIIRFSVPDGADYGYEIKDVKLKPVFGSTGIEPILTAPFKQGHFTYWRGYLDSRFDSLQWSGTTLARSGEQFEYVWHDSVWQNNHSSLQLVYHQGARATQFKRKVVALKGETSMIFNANNERRTSQVLAFPNEKWHLSLSGIEVNGPVGSIHEPKVITVTALRKMDMPPMGAGMINVTAHAAGFRLLPHNSTFNANLQVAIGIDTALLPAGYSTKHVRTYFFDEKANKWTLLPKDSLQNSALHAFALTNHFTDFINAIIKQPELPTTQAYTPTQFSDLKAANPLEGTTVIQPPSANNNGTVSISVPISVPAGRKGLQPQLAFQYSSEAGMGLMGLGWSINIPAINVDTRWGVPRYFDWAETESYLLNGEELQWWDKNGIIRPLFHRTDSLVPRNNTTDTTFFIKRVEGTFQRIMRRGTNPSNYWWEVTDKNGTTYYYGKYSNDPGKNSNCVLEKDGKVAYWALSEVKDINGNFIRYFYHLDTFSGHPASSNSGRQLYLDRIEYTGYGNLNGEHSIKFNYGNNDPKEVQINARYGFKEVTYKHITSVDIFFKNRIIRSYTLKYRKGHFEKRVLCFILESFAKAKPSIDSVLSNTGVLCQEGGGGSVVLPSGYKIHRFFYQAPIKEEEQFPSRKDSIEGLNLDISYEALFKQLKESLPNHFMVNLPTINDNDDNQTSFLGASQSFSFGGQGGLYAGIGFKPSSKIKKASISASYSHNRGNNKIYVSFQDIDGDGYPDRVLSLAGNIFYQKLSYTNGSPSFGPLLQIHGLPSLGRSTFSSNGFGAQANAGLQTEISANLSFNYAKTKTTTSSYFIDVNADGLIDFVHDGEVLFNQLNATGLPSFAPTQDERVYIGGTCRYVLHKGDINDSISIIPTSFLIDTLPDLSRVMMDYQPVRMWKAPFSGQVSIKADIQLFEDTSEARKQAISPDGVTYSIERNGDIIHRAHIGAGDYAVHQNRFTNIEVNEGDQIYFRLLPNKSRTWDDVLWAPEIVYSHYQDVVTDTNRINADNKKVFVFRSFDDFWVHGREEVRMPYTSTVRIHGTITSPPLSDSLDFKIINNAGSVIYSMIFDASNGISSSINIPGVGVSEDDSLSFVAYTSSRISYEKLKFNLFIDYESIPNYPDYDVNSEFDRVRIKSPVKIIPINRERVPSLQFVPGSSGNLTVAPNLSFGQNDSGYFYLTVKENEKIINKRKYTVSNGVITPQASISFNATQGKSYFFDYNTLNVGLTNVVSSSTVTLNNGQSIYAAGFYGVWHDTLNKFGSLYRGWGQFIYNKDTLGAIDETALVFNPFLSDTNNIKVVDESTFANDTSSKRALNPTQFLTSHQFVDKTVDAHFYSMVPDYESGNYKGFGDLNIISSDGMSNWKRDEGQTELHYENPIPVMVPGRKPLAVRKLSEQSSWTISATVGSTLTSGGGSYTRTRDNMLIDYLDLNGDRRPDIVGPLFTQFSLPNGILFPHVLNMQIPNEERYGLTEQRTNAFGANLAGTPVNEMKVKGGRTMTVSQGGGASYSSGKGLYMHIDINGDGLPDRVTEDGKVSLNLGYEFEPAVNWDFSDLTKSSSVSGNINPSLSLLKQVEKDQNSFSFGMAVGGGSSFSHKVPMDVNGDGLIDLVNIDNGEIMMNTGTGFVAAPSSSLFNTRLDNANYSVSGNLGGSLGMVLPLIIPIKFGGSLSTSLNYGKSFERGQFVDMNNDGFVDYVSINPSNGRMNIRYSDIAKFNLLERVESSTGLEIEIVYKNIPSTQLMPQSKWVMDTLKVRDGLLNDGADETVSSFSYHGGRYDRFERVFMGYDSVVTRQHKSDGVPYRSITEKFHTNDFLFKGLVYSKVLKDSLGRTFSETYSVFTKNAISSGARVNDSTVACFGPHYPALHYEEQRQYEGSNQPLVTRNEYDYSRFGNVITYKKVGDIAVSSDDVHASIQYRNDTVKYLIGLPLSITVNVPQGQLLRSRTAQYDSLGRLESMLVNLGAGFAITNFEYDQYGNITKMILPPNGQNQRMFYVYSYDDTLKTYPVRIEDAYGYISTSKYDLWLGSLVESTDMSGSKVNYDYNARGKLMKIRGPKETASGQPFTLRFAYWDDYPHDFPRQMYDKTHLWARTEHYDEFNAGNTISTVLFSDGLGRVVQTKKKSVVDGNEVMVVSGRMKFDEFGRTTEQFYPTTEPLGNDSLFNTNWPTSVQPSRVFYDVLDRPTLEIQPDATQTFHVYGFGTDQNGVRRFRKTTTDAEGTSVSVLTDPRELQMRIIAPLGAVTDFKYNALGELIESKDPEGFVTTYSYDLAGRRISRLHPDAGQTNWSYDPAGNLVSMANANLIANGQTVKYSYHFGQLTEVNYPTNPENNVFYAYGNAGNATGRILTMQDAAGVHAFEYGSMGEVTLKKTTGYVPVSGGEFYTFSTRWQYDSWNRVKSIEYPDGELVVYDYDKGGQLVSMNGTKTNTQDYVTDVRYDEFGSRTFFAYGNGTSSTYTYDANSRRLLNLLSTTGNGDMLNLTYTYDDVGNITRINNAETGVNGLGGNYTYNYVYDSLYRLIDSHGNTGSGAGYKLLMSYSPSGNIISKELKATKEVLGNTQVVNYANDYTYNNAHMVSMVKDMNGTVPPLDFQFDGAGNMTLQSLPDPKMGRHERLLCWDEENRLSATRDQYFATANIYDASGNRAWKLGGEVNWMWNNGQGWQAYGDLNLRTWYQSDLVTITDQAMTKHYFISGQRIASKLAESLAPEVAQNLKDKPLTPLSGDLKELGTNMAERIKRDFNCVGLDYNAFYPGETRLEALENLLNVPEQPDEYQVFFYHSDHLGSSSFITDINGDATQHLQYLPFGEDFVHQQNTAAFYTPYTFSGKERDVETSLSYFGARYYEAGLSVWLSVDPMSDKAPGWTPYRYGFQNPVKYIDPTGLWEVSIQSDENGKKSLVIIGQKGDSFKTLKDQTGLSTKELKQYFNKTERKQLGEGSRITELGNRLEGINEALNRTEYSNSNCFGTAVGYAKNRSVDPNRNITSPYKADEQLLNNFYEVDFPQWGDVIRYSQPDGYASANISPWAKQELPSNGNQVGAAIHFSTYLLTNKQGTQVFTKNGTGAGWDIMYESQLPFSYGQRMGIGTGSSTFR